MCIRDRCVCVCVCSQNSFFSVLCVASVRFSVCPVAGWAEVSEQSSPWSLTDVCGLTGCCFREAPSTWRPVSMLAPAASSTTSASRSVPQSQILLSLWDRCVTGCDTKSLNLASSWRIFTWDLSNFAGLYICLYQLRTILRLQGPWKWNLQVVLLTSFIRSVVFTCTLTQNGSLNFKVHSNVGKIS